MVDFPFHITARRQMGTTQTLDVESVEKKRRIIARIVNDVLIAMSGMSGVILTTV